MTVVLAQGGSTAPVEKINYTVKVVDFDGKSQSGVTVQFLKSGSPVAVQMTDSSGSVSAELPMGEYTVTLAFAGTQMYYEKSSAVLSPGRPAVTLRVTATVAKKPVQDWFGTVYDVEPGGTYVRMQANVVTYFAFTPTQEGVYRITASNPKAQLDSYGSINFPNKQSVPGATATSFELNVKENNLGGTYAIGITGVTECILIIERIGSAILDDTDVPWQEYQGKRPTKAYTLNGTRQFTYVDLTGSTASIQPVLGSDGYYHMNSATGKILYVNLGPDAQYISMYNMLGLSGFGGTRLGRQFYDENGNLVRKEDYTACMTAYAECRDPVNNVYPLTEDLMYMLKNGGEYMGWWNKESANYLFTDLGDRFNPELGWMFAVCYLK
jgi:hypothetical protein